MSEAHPSSRSRRLATAAAGGSAADRRDRAYWPRRAGLVLAICAILVAIAVLMAEVVARMDTLQTAEADNLQWALSQVEVEFLLLEDAVTVAKMTPEPRRAPELDAVRKRFDIFYSRLHAVQTSPHFLPVRADPEGGAALDRIGAFTTRMLAEVDAPPGHLNEGLGAISARMMALRPDVRLLTVEGLAVFAQISDARRVALGQTLMRLAVLTFILIAVLAGLAAALARLNRVNRARMAEIARTRARLETILATALDAVLVTDAAGRLMEMNHAAEEMFGLRAETARGRALNAMIVPAGDEAETDPGLAAYLRDGAPLSIGRGRRRMQGRRADGRAFPIELALADAHGAEGPLAIAVVRDLSDQDAADAELRAARDLALAGERTKAEFLAVMSHEMRTPLNGLLGTIDLLARDPLEPRQAEYLAIMQRSGRHLLRHVNDVLDIARAEAGQAAAQPEPFDLAELIDEVAAGQRGLAEAGGNRLEIDLPDPPLPLLEGDPARLRQVLLNLVGNAVKFTENGVITLAARRLEGGGPAERPVGETLAEERPATERMAGVELRVTDTGTGIAAEDLERVFADFVTLDASYRRNVEGTGLGLGIARRMVQAMDGEIGVESEKGRGSSFWVRLPLGPAPAGRCPGPAEDGEAVLPALRPLDLLVVEDNQVNRFVVREMLVGMGHKVTEASDGREGAALARAWCFDAILMDISMPRMDGVEAARAIRAATDGSCDSPIIALTAHAQPAEHARFRAAGMTESLTKPITRTGLAAVLARILRGEGPDQAGGGAGGGREDGEGAGAEAPPLINLGHLAEMSEELGESFGDLLARFIEEGEALLGPDAADKAPSPEALHRLAGSASVFGAAALQAGLARAEEEVAPGTDAVAPAGAGAMRRTLGDLWRATRAALSEALGAEGDERQDAPPPPQVG
ncbi:ATP-binding protein [Acidimangrovimonas sediminis]|uniref:ATP-binding protein n=1 Tax=Acidimangrovimonas sediminis TaxID=2056283 RepID=UPI000C807C96|nr:ATP-binding protein [Acidimangrovimonas sediminis]